MPMSSITKIPLILATTYGIVTSFTNPNPVITDNERRPDESKMFMYLMAKYAPHFRASTALQHNTKNSNITDNANQNMFWLPAVLELLAILLAEGTPLTSQEATTYALQILMPRNNVDNLRLTPLSLTGSVLVLAGTSLRLKCYHALQEFFTFEVTVRPNHRLITHGPYNYVRHPSYTGMVMVFIGTCCWITSRGSWIRESGILGSVAGMVLIMGFMMVYLRLVVGLLQRMPEEDKLMLAEFGKEWEDWACNVPYWLIPGIF
ncbi:hypothetical protein C0992_012313 [Termitomyces sp. T32_za158]|nr:hypothetical protein C0992_012313 [Termitomyces sp. T32_za158]